MWHALERERKGVAKRHSPLFYALALPTPLRSRSRACHTNRGLETHLNSGEFGYKSLGD